MSLKARVIAINQLLSDIYGREMRLSYLLSKLDFNSEDLNLISNELLSIVIVIFLETLEETVITFQDGTRQLKILHDSYGLTGNPQTLRQLAEKFDISHERIRQLKQKTLRKLKSNHNRSELESLFKQKVQQSIEVYNNKQLSKISNISKPKYRFALSSLSNGEQCLIISEENNQIIVAESNFQEFYSNFINTLRALEWDNFKTYSFEEVRKKHQRAYEKWTREEEELLINNLSEGLDVKEIAEMLGRQPSAIRSRMNKLGLNN